MPKRFVSTRPLWCILIAVSIPFCAQSQELRTVSVFSPVNPKLFVENAQNAGRLNPQLNDIVNLQSATNIRNLSVSNSEATESILVAPESSIRRNVVLQNSGELDAIIGSVGVDGQIVPILSLDLFQNVVLRAVVKSVVRIANGSVAITGSVDGVPGTLVTLVKKGDSLSGTVRIPDAVYKITPASS